MGVIGLWELLLESPQLLIDVSCYFFQDQSLMMYKYNEKMLLHLLILAMVKVGILDYTDLHTHLCSPWQGN